MPRMCYRLPHPCSRPPFAIRCDPGGCGGASGLQLEGAMITPIIHRVLTRADLDRLVAEIGRVDRAEARAAEDAVQTGDVDAVLDSPAALEAVRGRGGAPAAVPLTILWYIPVRAALRARGVSDVELADYTATVPVVFATWRAVRTVARGETGIGVWWRYVTSLPDGTVAQAEGATDVAALALWWAGCFPEWVTRRAAGLPGPGHPQRRAPARAVSRPAWAELGHTADVELTQARRRLVRSITAC